MKSIATMPCDLERSPRGWLTASASWQALKRCDSLAAAAADATKSVATRDDDAKSALQRAELLRVDKAYLSKELGEAQGREREAHRQNRGA